MKMIFLSQTVTFYFTENLCVSFFKSTLYISKFFDPLYDLDSANEDLLQDQKRGKLLGVVHGMTIMRIFLDYVIILCLMPSYREAWFKPVKKLFCKIYAFVLKRPIQVDTQNTVFVISQRSTTVASRTINN